MPAFLSLQGITKHFGGVQALRGVDFDVRAGEVHALAGENGAGKSTLMKIIAGNHRPTAGRMQIEGRVIALRNPHDALARGIALIHQETALVPHLSVAENVLLCQLPGVIRWRRMCERADALIQGLGFQIDPRLPVARLSVAQRQIVEIAKALSLNVKLLVLDEPTAALAPGDAGRLLDIVHGLRARAVAVVYISHRLHEIFQIAGRITVLKDGQTVGSVAAKDIGMDELIRMMVGRPLAALFPQRKATIGAAPLIEVKGLTRRGVVENVSFDVKPGEVLGLGGLIGSGRSELVRLIFGADRADSGQVLIAGREVTPRNARQGVRAGIGLVPEDRKGQAVALALPIRVNVTLARLADVSNRLGLLRMRRERRVVADLIVALRIKAHDMHASVSTLSGGNQQKVVLAKWFHAQGRVIILDEPTRGVDVGAKVEIYALINELASQGKAIVVVSSEHQELMGISDRILVMGAGRLRGQLLPAAYSEENIVAMSLGMERQTTASSAGNAAGRR